MPDSETLIARHGYAITDEDPDGGWRKEVAGKLLVLERETPRSWVLTLVSASDAPRMVFVGKLAACLAMDANVTRLVRAGRLS
jgi:hypothetical protein